MPSTPSFNPFPASQPTSGTTSPAGKGLDKDDVESFFAQEDTAVIDKPVEKPPEKPAREPKKEDEDEEETKKEEGEEDEDEIEIVEDEDEGEEEKLDLKTKDEFDLEVPPKKKEILKEYPEFFKKFPSIEKMIFRDREYTELFGSYDNAKEIAGKVEELDRFENQLLSGSTEEILNVVKSTDKKAYDKIVDNYLATLHRVDKDAYVEVCGNLGKQIIKGMVDEARRKNDDELLEAAQLLNEYLFMTKEWSPPTRRVTESKDSEDSELKQERMAFLNDKFVSARDDLQTRVDNALRSTISEHIDPRGLMSAYEKKNAVKECLDLVHDMVGSDTAYRKNLDQLWKNAFGDGFSQGSKDRIKSSYLGKSKSILSSAITKIRNEALKGSTGRKPKKEEDESSEKEETAPKERKGHINAGRPVQQTKKANERRAGESIQDFFMRD